MKGIVLAGGQGTRLYPMTKVISKQLLPVYDKPMIYYPMSVLISIGITNILIISNKESIPLFQGLFGDGSHLGLNIEYAVQDKPEGIAQSLIIGEDFIGKDTCCLILGDNIFFGNYIDNGLLIEDRIEIQSCKGGTIFAYEVRNPQRYGVVEFNKEHKAISIEEKPQQPKSNYAVTGLYMYDNSVIDIAKSLTKSARGEYEITDVNNIYLKNNKLRVVPLGKGNCWLDTGTVESLSQASQFIQIMEQRQGIKIGCLEELCFKFDLISDDKLQQLITEAGTGDYGQYLTSIFKEHLKDRRK